MTGVFQANLVWWYSRNQDGEMLLENTWLHAAHSERSDWNALEMEAEEATTKYYCLCYAQSLNKHKENNKMHWMLKKSGRFQLWHTHTAGAQVALKSEIPCWLGITIYYMYQDHLLKASTIHFMTFLEEFGSLESIKGK